MANPKRASGLLLLCFETVCVIIMISFFSPSLSFDAEAPSWQFVVVVVSFFSFAFSSASLYPFNIYLLTIKVLYNIEKGMERVTVDGPAAPRGKPVVDLCHHFRNFMIEKVKKKRKCSRLFISSCSSPSPLFDYYWCTVLTKEKQNFITASDGKEKFCCWTKFK